jgi:hypothetical protein
MAEPFMSPRSYTYSGGELSPFRERVEVGSAPGVAAGTEPVSTQATGGGGFLAGLERFAGTIAPFVEAAVAFKRGYDTGMPVATPGRFGGSRMGGQELIFQVLEDMRERNEAAARQARSERESIRQKDIANQVLLRLHENKEISTEDLIKGLQTGDLSVIKPTAKLPTQTPDPAKAPAAPKPPAEQPASPAASSPAATRVSDPASRILYGNEAINPDFRGYI